MNSLQRRIRGALKTDFSEILGILYQLGRLGTHKTKKTTFFCILGNSMHIIFPFFITFMDSSKTTFNFGKN